MTLWRVRDYDGLTLASTGRNRVIRYRCPCRVPPVRRISCGSARSWKLQALPIVIVTSTEGAPDGCLFSTESRPHWFRLSMRSTAMRCSPLRKPSVTNAIFRTGGRTGIHTPVGRRS